MSRLWIAVAAGALVGCPADEPPECTTVDIACAPLYEATFTNVYQMTLKSGCGSERSACHSRTGRQGGMSFEDEDTAHAALLAGRVKPGDAACSEMIVRVVEDGHDWSMPPGAPLIPAAQCSLIQWVQNGATR